MGCAVWGVLYGVCCMVGVVWWALYGGRCMVGAVWWALYGRCCMVGCMVGGMVSSINALMSNKAAGLDDMYSEQINNFGPVTLR